MIELNSDLLKRVNKMIKDYEENSENLINVSEYVDDWGELLDTVEYLLNMLKKKEKEKNV